MPSEPPSRPMPDCLTPPKGAAALDTVTRVGAEAVGKLESRGTLAAGQQADFIVLDRDLFNVDVNEVGGTKVLQTVIGGRTVHEAERQ